MQLQEQVITLEQANKLKELGFNKDSLYGYTKQREDLELKEWYLSGCRYFDSMSAYTASELMDILPDKITKDNRDYSFTITKSDEDYHIYYWNNGYEREGTISLGYKDNLIQALGDMLIYLLENNLLPTNNTSDE